MELAGKKKIGRTVDTAEDATQERRNDKRSMDQKVRFTLLIFAEMGHKLSLNRTYFCIIHDSLMDEKTMSGILKEKAPWQ